MSVVFTGSDRPNLYCLVLYAHFSWSFGYFLTQLQCKQPYSIKNISFHLIFGEIILSPKATANNWTQTNWQCFPKNTQTFKILGNASRKGLRRILNWGDCWGCWSTFIWIPRNKWSENLNRAWSDLFSISAVCIFINKSTVQWQVHCCLKTLCDPKETADPYFWFILNIVPMPERD